MCTPLACIGRCCNALTVAIFSSQLCQHEEEEKHLEEQLSTKASEYDSLYNEHDEEVRGLQQQKEQVMYQLEDMEERFQHLLSAHEKQVKKEQPGHH